MKYISTRGNIKPINFIETVMMGLADDGGLIIPEIIPEISSNLGQYKKLSYNELAYQIFKLFISDIPDNDLKKLIDASYSTNFDPEAAPLKKVGDTYILELFTGPTLSFKDVALQLIGNLFEYILEKNGGFLNILGATSGDTGSAGIYGVKDRKNINIFVMHPYKKISDIQEKQMTTVLSKNVFNIAVKGSFDDCQSIMKRIAGDIKFKKEYRLGAINSVNWARILAQIVYYFYAGLKILEITKKEKLQICVPTGNFGNVLASWYAYKMGLPVHKIILATNENDILSRFFNTGIYSIGKVAETISPAMDIQIASNFERYLYYKLEEDPCKINDFINVFLKTGSFKIDKDGVVDPLFLSDNADKKNTLNTIKEYYEKYDYILDPHTSVGIYVGNKLKNNDLPILNIATAHPAKFPDSIKSAIGKDIAKHPKIEKLKSQKTRCEILENDQNSVKEFMIKSIIK
ncbi:MAG: threonine synthase [Spirochaetes bacterium]|nr:threonine synthase [Spirochaetota bacterium]